MNPLNLRRAWINQPSTRQQHHDLHGRRVLAVEVRGGISLVFFTEGPVISMEMLSLALSPGWPEEIAHGDPLPRRQGRLTGTLCSVCNEPQRRTPSGDTCANGHGGAPPKEEREAAPAPVPSGGTMHFTDGRPLSVCDRALCGFNPITNCITTDPTAVTCVECRTMMNPSPWKPIGENCHACAHSFMEPDDDLTCGHPDAGPMGTYVGNGRGADSPGGHCGPFRPKFQQHPKRNSDGTLKS